MKTPKRSVVDGHICNQQERSSLTIETFVIRKFGIRGKDFFEILQEFEKIFRQSEFFGKVLFKN